MRNKFNTLQRYIYEHSVKEYHKETINGLFRAILEPVVSNQNFESCVFIRIFDTQGRESLLKRLAFSGAKIYCFCDGLEFESFEKNGIWDKTEFIIVLGQRYSASLIWDYSTGSKTDYSNISVIYNSKMINEISKLVLDNSTVDFKEFILKYVADRRENQVLNSSINSIVDILNDKNEEILLSHAEKEFALNADDTMKTANIVAEKAKFIAHEIKNNLSIINLYAKITEKRLENYTFDEEVQTSIDGALKNINNASQTISNLINDLRCLSSPYITEFDLKSFVLSTIMLCNEKANNAKIEIVVEEVPEISISSDITKLQCAFTNVIFNAVEAGSEGGRIRVSAQLDDNQVKIKVSNDGEMISKENQKNIFDENFTTKSTGNGLGLSICKKQLQLIDGDIHLIKSDELETVFEITLNLN